MKKQLTLLAGLLLLSTPTFATDFAIDTAHTSVMFKIRHLVSQTRGRFKDFSGSISFDEKKPGSMTAEAVIQTKSIDTDNAKRDDHLRSPDFFNIEKHPTITFKSTGMKGVNAKGGKMEGEFEMNGVKKNIVLDVKFLGVTDDPFAPGKKRAGFTASTKINRKDYGIIWNKTLDKGGTVVGDDVEITLEVEGLSK